MLKVLNSQVPKLMACDRVESCDSVEARDRFESRDFVFLKCPVLVWLQRYIHTLFVFTSIVFVISA